MADHPGPATTHRAPPRCRAPAYRRAGPAPTARPRDRGQGAYAAAVRVEPHLGPAVAGGTRRRGTALLPAAPSRAAARPSLRLRAAQVALRAETVPDSAGRISSAKRRSRRSYSGGGAGPSPTRKRLTPTS